MRRANWISGDVLQSIDIANTLQGGVSQPEVRLTKLRDGRQIELQVPGISNQQMHVKINNNQLIVYYEILVVTQGKVVPIPFIVYNKPIPYYIDANRIKATYEDKVLTVQLPYNELANGFHRDIPIES